MAIDPKSAKVISQWKYTSPFVSCRFDPSGKFVFAGAEDRSISRWTVGDGSHVKLIGHESWVHGLAFSKNGKELISGGCDGRLKWWPVEDAAPSERLSIDAHQGWIRSMCVSPDGRLLATSGNDKLVKIWMADTGELVQTLSGHESHVYSVAFDPTQQFLLSGELRGKVIQWAISDGANTRSFDAKALHTYNGGQRVDFGGVRSIAVAPDGNQLAFAGLHKATNPLGAVHEPLLLRVDWSSQKTLKSHVAPGVRGVLWRAHFFGPELLMAVSGGSGGGFLLFWNPQNDKEIHRFKLPNLARDMDVSTDGTRVVTAHYDRQLRITNIGT